MNYVKTRQQAEWNINVYNDTVLFLYGRFCTWPMSKVVRLRYNANDRPNRREGEKISRKRIVINKNSRKCLWKKNGIYTTAYVTWNAFWLHSWCLFTHRHTHTRQQWQQCLPIYRNTCIPKWDLLLIYEATLWTAERERERERERKRRRENVEATMCRHAATVAILRK